MKTFSASDFEKLLYSILFGLAEKSLLEGRSRAQAEAALLNAVGEAKSMLVETFSDNLEETKRGIEERIPEIVRKFFEAGDARR